MQESFIKPLSFIKNVFFILELHCAIASAGAASVCRSRKKSTRN